MKVEKTERGFQIIEFKDRYDEECSLQESSLASESCVWLGVDNNKLKMMAKNGQEDGTEWIEIPLHENVSILPGRMHLNQEQVRDLLPHLIRFAETGSLSEE